MKTESDKSWTERNSHHDGVNFALKGVKVVRALKVQSLEDAAREMHVALSNLYADTPPEWMPGQTLIKQVESALQSYKKVIES